MKTRVFPSILVATSIFSLYSKPSVDWEHVGEQWGNSFQHTKDGVQRLTEQTVSDNRRLYGHIIVEDVVFKKNLTCYGYTEFSNVRVHGVTTMYGPLTAESSVFKDMDVRCYNESSGKGIVKLTDCTVNKITLNGRLEATNTTLHKVITFSPETVLTDSTVQDINIMNAGNSGIVELHNTIVEGSITFSQKGGKVICKGTSEVRGTITNGSLKKE